MERRPISQRWIPDAFLRTHGMDILHPESGPTFSEFGFTPTDLEVVMARIKGGEWQVKAFGSRAVELEHRGLRAEGDGLRLLARDLFLRASVHYGRAQYHIHAD